MKLQILIPHYKEPIFILENLLNSIDSQLGVDFEDDIGVIICNDGIDVPIPIDLLQKYKFKIEYIINPHEGVSYTRNTLLNASNADFIMCCDCDDIFISNLGLDLVFDCLEKYDPDVFISAFYEESKTHSYILKETDSFLVHGKIFKRKYLLDSDIHWNNQLFFSGDTYFLNQALNLTDNIVYSRIPFYLYKWNDDSICRREKNHFTRSYAMKLLGDKLLIKRFIEIDRSDLAQASVVDMVQDMYFMSHSLNWQKDSVKDCTKRAEEEFVKMFSEFKDLYNSSTAKQRITNYNNKLLSYASSGPIEGYLGIDPWLNSLGVC